MSKTELAIDFAVIGGSVAGLATAVALRRVGHRVTVFEESDLADPHVPGGCRLPPNMTKILFHWGWEEEIRAISLTSDSIVLFLYHDGEVIGTHQWEEEVLKETGGEYLYVKFADLRKLFLEKAKAYGATVRLNAKVVEVRPEDNYLKLASGERVNANVIIGADGPSGLSRNIVIGEEQGGDVSGHMGSMTLHRGVIPASVLKKNPALAQLQESSGLHVWLGNGRSLLAFPIGPDHDFAYQFQVPSEGIEGGWDASLSVDLRQAIAPCEPLLDLIAENAICTASMTMREYDPPEEEPPDWVHPNAHMVLVGEAAHPFPPGSIQTSAMALEDAAVLAKLFSHLSAPDQIGSLLWAFQDLRQKRVESAIEGEMGHNFYMAMQAGEMQEERDKELRSKYRAGKSAMSSVGDDEEDGTSAQWEGIKALMGYDAEYEADNWWVQWGLLRERALGRNTKNSFFIQVSTAPG